jgi:hypothetical protein
MLSDAMRSRLQSQARRTMPSAIEIQRLTVVPDGEVGHTSSWATVETTVGRIGAGPRQPVEQVSAGQLTVISTWTIAVPAGTDLRVSDRLVSGGVTYEVLGISTNVSFEIERRATCTTVGE